MAICSVLPETVIARRGPTARVRICRMRPTWLRSIVMLSLSMGTAGHAQIKAQPPKSPVAPAWDKGIQPISRDSFYNAIACGKQGGANPPCVFWDAGLCRNGDFTLAMYTPYKQVAYEVWQAVSRKQEPPTPSFADAQRARVTVGITPVPAAKNPLTALVIKRGEAVVKPATQSLDGGGGRF